MIRYETVWGKGIVLPSRCMISSQEVGSVVAEGHQFHQVVRVAVDMKKTRKSRHYKYSIGSCRGAIGYNKETYLSMFIIEGPQKSNKNRRSIGRIRW